MASLARRETVFDELFDFRRTFDDIFHRYLETSASKGDRPAAQIIAVPPVEAWLDADEKKYRLRVALPGVDPSEIQISVEGNALTVRGEHKSDQEKKGADYLLREFSSEQFERTVLLPENIDTDKISAECNNGVLEITAPLSEFALPRRIEVKNLPKARVTTA